MSNEYAVTVQNVTKTFNYKKPKGLTNILKNLTHTYLRNRLVAVDDVSFSVAKGEILGIIGLNGGGKTTLLRMIAGVYLPDSGFIDVNGKMAPLLQIGAGFHNELTASENITIGGMLFGLSKSEIKGRIEPVFEFAELQEFQDMKLKHYSAGMRARLAFSLAMQMDPDIILVDEVLAVGDISFREKSFNAFLSFKRKKKTILFATHILGVLPNLCDKVLLLDRGKIITIGDPEEAIRKYKEIAKIKK